MAWALSQIMRKSGAAVSMAANSLQVASEKVTPVGLPKMGTVHMPLTAGSLTSSLTTAMSGPSSVMGAWSISKPNSSVMLKCRS